MTVDELAHLGLNVIVFRESVPTRIIDNRGKYELDQIVRDYTLIDSKWIFNHRLGVSSDDSPLKAEIQRAWEMWRASWKDSANEADFWDNFKQHDKMKYQYETKKVEYDNFKPSVLTQKIREADVVVVPRGLINKLRAEIPDARLAVLEDGKTGNFQLTVPATAENHPRVLVRALPSGFDEPRIDATTINFLFKEKPEKRAQTYSGFEMSYFSDPIDPRFYKVVENPSALAFINPVERASMKVRVPYVERRSRLDELFFTASENQKRKIVKDKGIQYEEIEIPLNNQGLGAKVNGYRSGSNGLLTDYRAGKIKRIRQVYGSLWIQPLDSIEEILDRQKNIGKLVDDPEYYRFMKSLEESINQLLEPYLHLSNMSKLICTVLLRSKWGSPIANQAFYDDFTRIAKDFIRLYERFASHLDALSPESRELKVLLAPIRYIAGEGGKLHEAYLFLKTVEGSKPRDFDELRGIFFKRLWHAGASRIKELEAYNPLEDDSLENVRINEGVRDSMLEKLKETHGKLMAYNPTQIYELKGMTSEKKEKLKRAIERMKTSGYNPLKDREVQDIDRELLAAIASKVNKLKSQAFSLDARRSPNLEALLARFHSQMPVSEADKEIAYLDYAGTRLAAYNAVARFLKGQGWTKPEILSGELGVVDIQQGWYPLTRLQQTKQYVRNDTVLNGSERVEIIDGTNAGGKTIDVRKTMFIATLALTGLYVPAEYAAISFFNRVRFRLKQTGMYHTGALVSELSDIGGVLKGLGTPILVGLDETFTSTNDIEGEAMTYSLVRRLAEISNARAIVTSHYPSLHDIQHDPRVTGVKFSHFIFEREGGRLRFPYRKLAGANIEGDYAVAIAENEGIHPSIIMHAKRHLQRTNEK
ncbi:MAG: hypothetical protein AABX33_04105 [Nanoarchaeota archaeon]